MMWSDFKKQVEAQGVKDEDVVRHIAIESDSNIVTFMRTELGWIIEDY